MKMIKRWIAKMKFAMACKWAEEFGLYVVQIRQIAGTEYIVDRNGSVRKLARVK